MKEFNVCITFDTDSDPIKDDHKNSISFSNLDFSLDKISNKVKEIEDKFQLQIPISWFVRIDNQIKSEFGSFDWLLKKYSMHWDKEISKENEIHWHAHIYENLNNNWAFPKKDEFFIKNIEEIFNFLLKNNFNPQCIRVGEAYMTNNIMNFLRGLGLKADSSGIPGRSRKDNEKLFDWSISPNKPYFPAKSDYRLNDLNEDDFLEIPMNTIKTKCIYDKSSLLRYANLAFNNDVIYKGLRQYIEQNDLLVTISHPYEFFENYNNNKNLLSNNLNSLNDNIKAIIEICKDCKKEIKFIKIKDIIKKFKND